MKTLLPVLLMLCLTIPAFAVVEYPVDENYDGAMSVRAADVDGDGDTDVLGASLYYNDITWWENIDGYGTSWTEHTVDGNVSGTTHAHPVDLDNDGDIDVVGSSYYDDYIHWWENDDGSGTSWTEHTVDANFGFARFVYAADVNGDGHIDVLVASEGDDEISWWENDDGSGTSWTKRLVDGSLSGACCVHSIDVDGDGDLDIVGSGFAGHEVAWWRNSNGAGTS